MKQILRVDLIPFEKDGLSFLVFLQIFSNMYKQYNDPFKSYNHVDYLWEEAEIPKLEGNEGATVLIDLIQISESLIMEEGIPLVLSIFTK